VGVAPFLSPPVPSLAAAVAPAERRARQIRRAGRAPREAIDAAMQWPLKRGRPHLNRRLGRGRCSTPPKLERSGAVCLACRAALAQIFDAGSMGLPALSRRIAADVASIDSWAPIVLKASEGPRAEARTSSNKRCG